MDEIEEFEKSLEKEKVESFAAPMQKKSKAELLKEKKEREKMEEFRKKQLKIATKYKDGVLKKYSKIVKAVVIFGSFTRGDFHEKSDIDILVIYDDTTAKFTFEMKDEFDFRLREIAKDISSIIVVQPAWSLTEFWDMARIGHPLLYTIVRDGWALYDSGFFIPIRKLLEAGKIPTTLEAVEKFMESVPQKITRVETAKLYMIAEDLYYAMLNSSQAVLMFMGLTPPAPKHTPDAVAEHLVNTKLLENEYLENLKAIIEFRKNVEHKVINNVSGQQLDDLIEKTKKFVSRMEQLLLQLQKNKKDTIVQKNYEVLIKAAVATLKKMNKLPEDPKDLPKAVKEVLIDGGYIHESYTDVFRRVIEMRKMLDEDKIKEIPQKDVELVREYVRRFVRDVAPILEDRKIQKPYEKKKKKK